jgi:hypothetical protein
MHVANTSRRIPGICHGMLQLEVDGIERRELDEVIKGSLCIQKYPRAKSLQPQAPITDSESVFGCVTICMVSICMILQCVMIRMVLQRSLLAS